MSARWFCGVPGCDRVLPPAPPDRRPPEVCNECKAQGKRPADWRAVRAWRKRARRAGR